MSALFRSLIFLFLLTIPTQVFAGDCPYCEPDFGGGQDPYNPFQPPTYQPNNPTNPGGNNGWTCNAFGCTPPSNNPVNPTNPTNPQNPGQCSGGSCPVNPQNPQNPGGCSGGSCPVKQNGGCGGAGGKGCNSKRLMINADLNTFQRSCSGRQRLHVTKRMRDFVGPTNQHCNSPGSFCGRGGPGGGFPGGGFPGGGFPGGGFPGGNIPFPNIPIPNFPIPNIPIPNLPNIPGFNPNIPGFGGGFSLPGNPAIPGGGNRQIDQEGSCIVYRGRWECSRGVSRPKFPPRDNATCSAFDRDVYICNGVDYPPSRHECNSVAGQWVCTPGTGQPPIAAPESTTCQYDRRDWVCFQR